MNVSIYIQDKFLEYTKIDLFDDEVISFVAKATDLNDISKVFSDVVKTFSIPCSPTNNYLFQHYYNNDNDNGLNAAIRIPCYIEIGTLPFRTGKLQLEGSNTSYKNAENYKVTFYSDLVSLSDLWGDDTLNQLGKIKETSEDTLLVNYDHTYSYENIITLVSGGNIGGNLADGSVMYPLISPKRVWKVGTGGQIDPGIEGQTTDITTPEGGIVFNELKPALKVDVIIKAIEQRYGITFSRDFFDTAPFQDLFVWLSNSAGYLQAKTDWVPVTFIGDGTYNPGSSSPDSGQPSPEFRRFESDQTYRPNMLNTYDKHIGILVRPDAATGGNTYKVRVSISVDGGVTYNTTIADRESDLVSGNLDFGTTVPTGYDDVTYKFYIQATSSLVAALQTRLTTYKRTGNLNVLRAFGTNVSNNGVSLNARVIIAEQMPNIKIKDFFTGIVKMFNLTIRPNNSKSFSVKTLNNYYEGGDIIDITKYVDIEKVEINRPKLNKVIRFKYEKTENILGKQFRDVNGGPQETGYGDLASIYDIDDKEELKVEVPFENMLFERLTDVSGTDLSGNTLTNLVVGSAFSDTYSPNNVKPILFYDNGLIGISPKNLVLKRGTSIAAGTYALVNRSHIIGNENNVDTNITNTINFNAERSPVNYQMQENSLYKNYWDKYIQNIYAYKQRKFSFPLAVLPQSIALKLTLDDRLNINDKQYRIDDYSIDLNSGKCKLNLFANFYDSTFSESVDSVSLVNIGNQVPTFGSVTLTTNSGLKHYDVSIITDPTTPWGVTKTSLTSGQTNDWITLPYTTGVGNDIFTFFVNQSNNTVATREINLVFTINGVSYSIIVQQQPIIFITQ